MRIYIKKSERVKKLQECLDILIELKDLYTPVSPGWVLINTAHGHIISVHHLESDTNFDGKIIGVKK